MNSIVFEKSKKLHEGIDSSIPRRKCENVPEKTFSHWLTQVRDFDGNLKSVDVVHNLRTTTATGYTNAYDWQAKTMGGGIAPIVTFTGNATATTGTSLTNSGASFPTTGQALAGFLVVAGPRATSSAGDAISFGMIVSNTGTALTIDKWYTSTAGAWSTGTTPNATCTYIVLPVQMPAMWIAVTATVTAPTTGDIVIASEATTNGFARQLATFAHTAAAATYTMQTTFTASGALTPAVYCLSGSGVASTGPMPFTSAIPTPPAMIATDTLSITSTVSI